MSATHEIVTVQLGHYANFVGTHWWNTQEASFIYNPIEATYKKEINHDVLFREGRNLLGDITYTPRLVLLDLKGSLRTLRQDGCLYDLPDATDDATWGYDITLHKESSVPKNNFLKDLEREEKMDALREEVTMVTDEKDDDEEAIVGGSREPYVVGTKLYDLNDSVHVWSDYLRIHLHPKTVHLVEKYQHANELEQFDLFGLGQRVYKDHQTRREIEDKLHFFLEECDQLQGVHMLTDIHDGFGGLSTLLLEDLQDELSTKSLLTLGLSPPSFPDCTPAQDMYRVMNTALTVQQLTNHSSAFIPLSLAGSLGRKPAPATSLLYVDYQVDSPYHTSAILAASLDTATLPYRLDECPSLLSHLTQAMTPYGRKILNLYSALPFPLKDRTSIVDTLLNLGDQFPWQPVTPGASTKVPCTAQSLVTRGLHSVQLKGPRNPQHCHVLDRCETLSELLSLYSQEMSQCSLNAICNIRQPCRTTAPFPHIFNPKLNRDGIVMSEDRPKDTGVEMVSVMTSLQSSTALKPMLDQLISEAGAINISKHHCLVESGIEADEIKEALLNLATIRDNYDDSGGDMV